MSKGLGVLIRRGVAAMASAALLSAALQGCGGDDTDDTYDPGLPSESELTASNPTPTPTDPTTPVVTGPQQPPLPDAAMGPGKKGAKAFVAYYIKLLNYAQHTGDTAVMRQYGPNCRKCMAFARLAESIYGDGGWLKGGSWTPVAGTWFALASGPAFLVGLNIDVAASRELRRAGAKVVRHRGAVIGRDFRVVRRGDSDWRVISMEEPL